MTDALPSAEPAGFRIRGWHVLAGVSLFFAIVIAVDVVFVMAAYRTFPGQSAKNPYEAGLAYNQTLARRAAEAQLGWTGQAEALADGLVRLELKDAAGRPLPGLLVRGELQRPATSQGKVEAAFRETAPGIYLAKTTAGPGAWDLSALARDGRGRELEVASRLVWP
jgi:nitrogen fixation protein FixH